MTKTTLLIGLLALGCGGKGNEVKDAASADRAAGPDAAATSDAVVGGKVEVGPGPVDATRAIDGVIQDAAADVVPLEGGPIGDGPAADLAPPQDAPPADAAPAADAPPSLDGLFGDASVTLCLGTCLDLERQYATAFTVAAACTPGAADQCRQPVTRTLTCGCPAFVNDASGLEPIRARWRASGCDACITNCTPFVCPPAPASTCNRSVTSVAGSCANPFFP
jgi:hypothetical protein